MLIFIERNILTNKLMNEIKYISTIFFYKTYDNNDSNLNIFFLPKKFQIY